MISGCLVADALPGAGHRQHGHRGQPHRRLAPVGPRRMTTELAPPPPAAPAPAPPAALKVEDLSLAYVVRGIRRPVLRGVSFEVRPGESYGLVGESGCGKSTTAYAAVRYLPRNGVITGGRILVVGRRHHPDERRRGPPVPDPPRLDGLPGPGRGAQPDDQDRAAGRRGVHDPRPEQAPRRRRTRSRRSTASRSPIPRRSRSATRTSCRAGCSSASSSPSRWRRIRSCWSSTSRRPGSTPRSRRACSTSSASLQAETNAAVLLIAHNLGVIRTMCDRVGVMYAGKIVEEGDAAAVFEHPEHPYTLGLLRSLPRRGIRKTERALSTIPGNLPQIGTPLPTCVFVDRCPLADELCRTVVPPVVEVGDGRWTRCHHRDRIDDADRAAGGRRHGHGPRRPRAGHRARLQDVPPERPRRAGAGRGRPRAVRRRDARAGRRIGLGQVDPGQDDPRHREPRRRQQPRARRSTPWPPGPPAGRPRTSARSRWSSRTPTRRSTAAGPRGTSSSARSAS